MSLRGDSSVFYFCPYPPDTGKPHPVLQVPARERCQASEGRAEGSGGEQAGKDQSAGDRLAPRDPRGPEGGEGADTGGPGQEPAVPAVPGAVPGGEGLAARWASPFPSLKRSSPFPPFFAPRSLPVSLTLFDPPLPLPVCCPPPRTPPRKRGTPPSSMLRRSFRLPVPSRGKRQADSGAKTRLGTRLFPGLRWFIQTPDLLPDWHLPASRRF